MVSRIVLLVNNDPDPEPRIVERAIGIWGHIPIAYSEFRPALDAIEGGMRYDVLLTDLDLGLDVRHLPSGVTQASSFTARFESGTRIIQASREHQPNAPVIAWSYASAIAVPIADGAWTLYDHANRGESHQLQPTPGAVQGIAGWLPALEDRLWEDPLSQDLRPLGREQAMSFLLRDSAIERLEVLRHYLALPNHAVKRMPSGLRPAERPTSFLGRLFPRRDGD